jgi:hypothetical protein
MGRKKQRYRFKSHCMHFEADDQHMHHMFSRETVARERFNMNVSKNIKDSEGLYDEDEKK